ncbi:MAG: 3-oxo-5-alpha-steroid 4-dehydrogenase, partial [Myxococcota bacterium]
LYRYVSCPNYLGEMVQWIGWAIAMNSLAGVSFAVWTVANLLPRALTHHRWYRDKFAEYPAERKAVIPFVL